MASERLLMFTLALVLALTSQTAPAPATPSTDTDQTGALARVGSLGTVLFALDRAAWVASDALTATVPKETLARVGGWVVERSGDRALTVTFYSGTGDAARAIFVAEVADGKVSSSRTIAADTVLTPAQAVLARARESGAAEAARRGLRPCTPEAFNTVVVGTGTGDAPSLVYLLSAQPDARTFPAGGHYRMLVHPDGRVSAFRPFTRACLNLSAPPGEKGRTPVGSFVNHVLDPTPTEIHVFTSVAMRLPLFVGTKTGVWQVRGRTITSSDMKPPAPPQ
jgi:hypothetical protein